jgi:putative metallohydrolase (TIGR04338 family)
VDDAGTQSGVSTVSDARISGDVGVVVSGGAGDVVSGAADGPVAGTARRPVGPGRDQQRAKVYAAEHLVHRMFDRSATSPAVEIAGSRLTLPPERRFGDLDGVRTYTDRVLALNWVRRSWPRAAIPVRVRERSGARQAHYEREGACMAVPTRRTGSDWALRELVILHELAHHLADDGEVPHGGRFVDRLLALVDGVVGPEAALVLRITMLDLGVRVG